MNLSQSLDAMVGSLTREGNRKAKLTLLLLLLSELNLLLHLITEQSWQTVAMAILGGYLVADVAEKHVKNGAAASPVPPPAPPVTPPETP